MTVGQLDVNFRRSYAEAWNKAGEPYNKSTLHSDIPLRYLKGPPFSQGLNLSFDPRFKRSNAQIIHLKRQGKENVHKPAIEEKDLKKLKTSRAIALTSALTLLQNLWFHVVLGPVA